MMGGKKRRGIMADWRELNHQAREWWEHDDTVPIAFSDFSDTCPEYLKP